MSRRRAGDPRRRRHAPRRSSEDNVRVAAAWVVERTLASSAPMSNFLQGALKRFDERDQALLRELVMGTLRWLRRLDDVIMTASERRLDAIEAPLRPLLRVATYQLLFLPRIPAYAAVDEAVEQAACVTHRGGASFVNAVLRRIGRHRALESWPVRESDPVRCLGIELSHPDFLVERWSRRWGQERARQVMEANNQPKALQLLAFRDRGGRELAAEELIDASVEVEPATVSPLGLTIRNGNVFQAPPFSEGCCYVQDEASQAAALLPPPRPGERILDAAAAPGGKTFASLAWEASARIVMADVGFDRLAPLRANLRRLRRSCSLVLSDAGNPGLRGAFDRVIIDLPCSGTGTLRKHPELKWRLSPDEVGRLASEGLRMLLGSAPLVAPGGFLVAMTCSLEREENEDVVQRFLAQSEGFTWYDFAVDVPSPLERWIEAPGRWRIFPQGEHDGFTVQVLKRQ